MCEVGCHFEDSADNNIGYRPGRSVGTILFSVNWASTNNAQHSQLY